jgi:dipeptidyl aminopeptidase/acylaminoacyl peptidase
MLRVRHFLLSVAIGLGVGGIAAEPAEVTPVENFFQLRQIRSTQVSPNGRYVAFLSPVAGHTSVVVFDLTTGKVEPVARAYDGNIDEFFWKGSDRIFFAADPNGRESQAMFSIELKSKSLQVIAENFRENRPDAAFASLADPLLFDPTHVLIFGRSSHGSFHGGLYRANLLTGDREPEYGDDPETSDLHPDNTGAVQYRYWHHAGRTYPQLRGAKGMWRPLAGYEKGFDSVLGLNDPLPFYGFASNNRIMYLGREIADGRFALFGYDIEQNAWGAPLFECDTPFAVRLSPSHDRIISVRYGPDYRSEKWFDQRWERLATSLQASFPKSVDVHLLNSDDSEKVFTIVTMSDVSPPAYYFLDTRGKPQLVELGKAFPALDGKALHPMRPITYRARDGLEIHGYLTLPSGAEGKRVPLILNPHGGPYGARDEWGFNPEVQFLASLGYAVLQPNYRGSGGYGEKFYLAGQHQWGRKMQDDLTDAVKWAIDQGIADPKRVCIYGASYGGYAALAGAVFTPDLYCCAINYVGVSDMDYISNWQHEESEFGESYYRGMIGDDREFIHAVSPVYYVDQIKIPTFHAYGENDPRVKIENWKELERELKKYHKTYETIREENEGHGFHDETAQIRLYRRMAEFLHKYDPVD